MWACFGLVFVFGKAALNDFFFLDFILLRMLIAGSILLTIHFYKRKNYQGASITRQSQSIYLWIGVLLTHIFWPFLAEYWATQHLIATKISLIYSFSPIITAIIARALGAEYFNWQQKIGLLVGFIGLCLPVLLDQSFTTIRPTLPDFILLSAVISAALAWFLIEKLLKNGESLLKINGISMLGAGIFFLILRALFYSASFQYLFKLSWQGWIAFFLVMFLSNFVGYTLYGQLLRVFSPTSISMSGFLCPIFAMFFSKWILNEYFLGLYFWVTLGLGLIGFVIYSAFKQQ